ncbi:cytochrome P450 [Streptomyces turgidiscabies]|uniref:Cytochrome P450 n=1 Tax=Streptomyces turgidiscabies TaxID=85558 RepID=A0ABU0RR72_9ACTN|nr:cytochrome P450 [Streptomyces turgidiscabies]MDQ0934493.1 cytochrome P450 [Streptomyces turgidiscabies]
MPEHHAEPLDFPFTFPSGTAEPEELALLRRESPVARVSLATGDEAWLVTRHSDVQLVLNDERFSRAAAEAPDAPRMGASNPGPDVMLGMDGPDHARLRRLAVKHFTTHRVERLRPWTQRLADSLLDDLVQGEPPGDLVPGLALPLPLMLVLELLGVPRQDSPQLCAWTDTAFSMTRHSQGEINAARGHLEGYVTDMIGVRRERPGDDLLSALVAERDEGGRLTEKELIGFAFLLITAGYLSTANAISSGILTLLLHPAELDRLRARPELVPAAVEELLRYNPSAISGALPRVALEDVDLGGVTVRAGEAVVPAIGSANHDASVFHAPERVDVAREANPHLAFGYGVHRCLGAQMARMELQVAVATLLRRLPTIRLAVPEHELRWKDHPVSRGLLSLPVVW